MDMQKELDKIRLRAFVNKDNKGNNTAFLSALMCQLDIQWDSSIPTAAVNQLCIKFNPDFMMGLTLEQRGYVLIHELWHLARLHGYRMGTKDPMLWNIACDYVINNAMIKDGYRVDSIEGSLHSCSIDPDTTEEEIYHQLKGNKNKPELTIQDLSTTEDGDKESIQKVAMAINKAATQARMMNKHFSLKSLGIKDMIELGMSKQLNWDVLLANWFDDLVKQDWSWSRPNRRHEDYLPSIVEEETLKGVCVWLDSSGSMTDDDLKAALGTIHSLLSRFNELKVELICFDTQINSRQTFTRALSQKVEIDGRGGTIFNEPAREINKNPDKVHIVISDMYFDPVDIKSRKMIYLVPEGYNKEYPFKHKHIIYRKPS